MQTTVVFLLVLSISASMAHPKFKKPPLPLSGLHGMKYMPLVPYNFLGLNPIPVYGYGFAPRPKVVSETPKSELPAPYVPQYGDMEKLMGYGGLPMPYGGYSYPLLYGYE